MHILCIMCSVIRYILQAFVKFQILSSPVRMFLESVTTATLAILSNSPSPAAQGKGLSRW